MSEEEKIIYKIEEILIKIRTGRAIQINDDETIQSLLDLYTKEKEKNKELEEENQTQQRQLNDAFDRGFIHKDKIKEKIEEIRKRKDIDGACETALAGFQREAKLDVLQDLLEE